MPIELTGTEEVFKAFRRIRADLKPAILNELGQVAFDSAFRDVDKHSRSMAQIRAARASGQSHTGFKQMLRSLKHVKSGTTHLIYHDLQVAQYAVHVHWGTKARIVKPSEKKALRWAAGGKFFFSKGHRISGIKADPWLVRAGAEAERKLPSIINKIDRSWP